MIIKDIALFPVRNRIKAAAFGMAVYQEKAAITANAEARAWIDKNKL